MNKTTICLYVVFSLPARSSSGRQIFSQPVFSHRCSSENKYMVILLFFLSHYYVSVMQTVITHDYQEQIQQLLIKMQSASHQRPNVRLTCITTKSVIYLISASNNQFHWHTHIMKCIHTYWWHTVSHLCISAKLPGDLHLLPHISPR